MKILAIEKEKSGFGENDFVPLLKAEAKRIWDFYIDGFVREIYFTPSHTVVLVLECYDENEAGAILGSLPLVQKGLIEFDITVLLPYDGFERLFEN
jgi:hypothetical protein